MSKCVICGLEGDFCGYHDVGPGSVSMCVSCGKQPVTLWRIRVRDEKYGGYYLYTQAEALSELSALLDDDDIGSGYSVTKETTTNLEKYSMSEFEGF